jgi:hypothetical protein
MKVLFLCAALCFTAQQQHAPQLPPKPKPKTNVSCIASREDWGTHNVQTGEERDEENWEASCTLTVDEVLVWKGKLVMAHPATFREAIDAIQGFRNERAPELVKKYLAEKPKA